jgi:hypothetical protein
MKLFQVHLFEQLFFFSSFRLFPILMNYVFIGRRGNYLYIMNCLIYSLSTVIFFFVISCYTTLQQKQLIEKI